MLFRVWEYDATCANQNAQLMVTFVQKWGSSSCHFVEKDSESPPVY